MDTDSFFLASDSAVRGVIDDLRPDDFDLPAPAEWSSRTDAPTLRDIVWYHAYEEAWVPDLLAGKAVADGDPHADADLLGDDPIAAYDALNDAATAAARAAAPDGTVRFTYGDFPTADGLVHLAMYRAFQAWLIARLVGRPITLPDDVLDGIEEHVLPHVDEWREIGIFPPEVEAPGGADRETLILARTGFLAP